MKLHRLPIYTIFFCIVVLLFTCNITVASASSFLTTAKKCHNYLYSNDFYYSVGVEIPLDRAGNRRVDCSSYVSWCLYEETDGAFSTSKDSDWFMQVAKDLLQEKTPDLSDITSSWKVITNSADIKPGDIMCYTGHVHIYAGKSSEGSRLVYNAGSDDAIGDAISIISESYFASCKYALRVSEQHQLKCTTFEIFSWCIFISYAIGKL